MATKTVTSPFPLEMAEKFTKTEKRVRSALFRETLGKYDADWEWGEIYRYGETKAKQGGITEDRVEDMIDARRR